MERGLPTFVAHLVLKAIESTKERHNKCDRRGFGAMRHPMTTPFETARNLSVKTMV